MAARTWKSQDLRAFRRRVLPVSPGLRRVVVRDHAAIHRSRAIREALPALSARGIDLWYRPPWAPARNDIEPLFGVPRHRALPRRTYDHISQLVCAIPAAFQHLQDRLQPSYFSMSNA